MKKKVIKSFIACFWISFNINSFSQEIKEIKIDFLDKKVNTNELCKIKEGDFYRLVIDNLNLNLFRVQVNYSDTIYSKPLETPTFASFELDAITKAISSLSDLSTSVNKSKDAFNKALDTLNNTTLGFPKNLRDGKNDYERLKVRINQENVCLKKINDTIKDISYKLDNLKLSVYLFKLESLKLEGSNDSFNLEEAVNQSLGIRSGIMRLKAESNENRNNFDSDYEKYSEDIRKKEDIKKAISALNEAYDKLITTLDKAIVEVNADNINTLLSQVVLIENNSNNTYKSVPMQFNGEQAILEYKIIPRDEKYLLQSYSAKILFPKRKSYYFSVGLSFYGSSLYDKAYSSIGTTINDTIKYRVIKEDDLNAEIGIASLIRIGKKFDKCDCWGFHLNFGPGISISNNIKPRLLFGMGFSLGNRHNINMDLGVLLDMWIC